MSRETTFAMYTIKNFMFTSMYDIDHLHFERVTSLVLLSVADLNRQVQALDFIVVFFFRKIQKLPKYKVGGIKFLFLLDREKLIII